MHTLSEAQYQAEAEPILRRVFVNDDPFEEPFSPNITGRIIIYPCYNYLETPLIDALIAAASSLGDTSCYLTQLWRDEKEPNHCYIPLLQLHEFYCCSSGNNKLIEKIKLLSEYVIYSGQGKWGLMVSHEHHGMLGGSPEFIEAVYQVIPDLDRQVYDFLKNFQLSKAAGMRLTLEWLPELLTHVYGIDAAEKMLRETGLP
ncbi:MAG: hypothetical protein AB4426_12145 [Xenococcaceae cyanobacterium]